MNFAHCWGLHCYWLWLAPVFFMIFFCFFARPLFRRSRDRRSEAAFRDEWKPSGCWGAWYGSRRRWDAESPRRV